MKVVIVGGVAGGNLWQAREALCEQLPFIVTQHEANLGY